MARKRSALATSIGKRLTKARERLGQTQEDVAQSIGLELGTYGHYERGWSLITTESLLKVADALAVSVAYLLGLPERDLNEEEQLLLDTFRAIQSPDIRRTILSLTAHQVELDRKLRGPEEPHRPPPDHGLAPA